MIAATMVPDAPGEAVDFRQNKRLLNRTCSGALPLHCTPQGGGPDDA